MLTKTLSYADKKNLQYTHVGARYVSLNDRFNEIMNSHPNKQGLTNQLKAAIVRFKKNNPHITQFSDLQLAEAKDIKMSVILIDATIQRILNLGWVIYIINNFREAQVDAIKLYEVLDGGDLIKQYPVGTRLFGAWDAQHTSVVLWILATQVFNEDPSNINVPCVIHKVKNRADIRENFVNGNSDAGKMRLDSIDLFIQMVIGVRLDGSTVPEWVEAELKQQYLEKAGLFVTAEKFGDTNEIGAISRMAEMDKYTSDIIRMFCVYSSTITPRRSIDSQEIEILCAFLSHAKGEGINYTDAQIVSLGNHLNALFGSNFHESSPFWQKVSTAYKEWHKVYYKGLPTIPGKKPRAVKVSKNWNTGGTFLVHQLRKTWKGNRVPTMEGTTTPFIPKKKDLY